MEFPREIGLYGILTDPLIGYERLAAVMVEKGLKIIQLRIKDAPAAVVERTARAVRAVVPPGVVFIVNDDSRIARDSGADGVHLGQGDAPIGEALAVLGPKAIIGLSTHDPEQTRAACALGPAYIGVGPVFPTPTKKHPDPVIGLAGMAAMLELATVPAVVLGGIDHSNVREVLAAGAQNLCAVRCINRSEDPGAEIERLLRAMDEAAAVQGRH